jgi:hypothetical protein
MQTHSWVRVGLTALALAGAVTVSVAQGLSYPPLYTSLGLPQLPKATLTSNGRQTTSLRDGLSLRLSTSAGVSDVRAFYASALEQAGWKVAASRPLPINVPVANVQATKDRVTFSASMTAQGGTTQVNITVTEQ